MTRTSDIDSAKKLHHQLVSMRMAAYYDIYAQICLHERIKAIAAGKQSDDLHATIGGKDVTLKEFLRNLEEFGSSASLETKRNANRFLTRNHLKEVFRLTQSYAINSGEITTMKGEEWYEFARILVNSLSHNFRLKFSKADRTALPVEFNGLIIEESMAGSPIETNLETLLQLSDRIIEFVEDRLD